MGRLGRIARVAGLAIASLVLAGCDILSLLGGDPFPIDPEVPFPSADATFTSGTATVELEGETITLDQLVGGGTLSEEFGTNVTWTNGEGWYLTFYGYPGGDGFDEEAYLSLDRLFDRGHWVIYNPERCVTTVDANGPDGLSGSAVCRGLEWSDYFGAFGAFGAPVAIPGEPAFDADITFDAHEAEPASEG